MSQKSLIFLFLCRFPRAPNLMISEYMDLPKPSVRRVIAELKKEGLYKIEKE